MEKAYEQLQFYLVKNRNSQITNKNEKNETEEKKGKCNIFILNMYKKVDSFSIKNHVIVIF